MYHLPLWEAHQSVQVNIGERWGNVSGAAAWERYDVTSGYERMLATSQATGRKETAALERLSEPCVRRWYQYHQPEGWRHDRHASTIYELTLWNHHNDIVCHILTRVSGKII